MAADDNRALPPGPVSLTCGREGPLRARLGAFVIHASLRAAHGRENALTGVTDTVTW